MRFGGDIRARQLDRSIGGLLGHAETLSLLNVEAVEVFMLMRDASFSYFQRGFK